VLPILLCARAAWAHPPPEPEEEVSERPRWEWSSWIRLAYGQTGLASPSATPLAATGSTTTPPPPAMTSGWEGALGADVTLGVTSSGDTRVGPWVELRGFHAVAGVELALTAVPHELDMFQYDGQGVLIVRAGASDRVATGSIAWGYLAPWSLWGPWRGSARYMIGVRLVATATRSLDDPRDWSATFGLEAEPVGSIRYLLGIRSWYR